MNKLPLKCPLNLSEIVSFLQCYLNWCLLLCVLKDIEINDIRCFIEMCHCEVMSLLRERIDVDFCFVLGLEKYVLG